MRFDRMRRERRDDDGRARMMRAGREGGRDGGRGDGQRGHGGDDDVHHRGRGFGRGPGGGRGGFEGGGRGRRMFAGGELRLVLLALIGDAERHGYELIRAIGDLTGGRYAPSPGVVYPTLSLLVDEGLIAETAGDGARKAFAATEAGRAEIAAQETVIAGLRARLRALAEEGAREASPPVRRAMANLKMALAGRLAAEDFATETAHAIADVLDEAARRIERL
ncbi:MAG: helix-turn-helix transcriptional regulator [Sphingomonadales bacterium]|nr:helix-turn-helix transcriptional regulator [Sphingomonadales bacterium]